LAAHYGVPAIYFNRLFAKSGGLINYSPDYAEQFRQAREYIDRILKGAKPADLPVQQPTKYELIINLKTAKALGLDVPIHVDIKKLGRFQSVGHRVTGRRSGYCSSQGAGWEFVHVAIDDHSRLARADIFPDQKKESAVAFLIATVAYFRSLGITVERVMTDNGSCYLSKAFTRACKQLAIKHIRIKPYTPQTNGKAERFIQTALREWAYATAFEHSDQRHQALPAWLHRYNWHRPHASLARKSPISRIGLTGNNLLEASQLVLKAKAAVYRAFCKFSA
jgi:integrase-like protein/ABC transporter substrate binding protein